MNSDKKVLNLTCSPAPLDLVQLQIETLLGSHYTFPDMSRAILTQLLEENNIAAQGSLTLVNVSNAVFVIPVRIIKTLYIDGVVKWTGPHAAVHELQDSGTTG